MTSSSTFDVSQATLATLGELVATGRTTPAEILEAYLQRVGAVEDRVQAWSHLDIDGARTVAAVLTEEAKDGRLRGPLHGVPVGVKDEFHVAGMPTYFADPEGKPQPEDATPVTRLRDAGAIILGKTHMPIDGRPLPTRNPWNFAHTAGGTSTGSGAVVAARMVPFALGEQTAGSNLRPAAYCGVVGFKPTFGRISRFGCYQFSYSHDHVGLIGLTPADVALVLSLLAGPDPRDRTARDAPPTPAGLDLSGMRPPRIGVVCNVFPEHYEPAMQEAVERAVARSRELGATIRDVMLPEDFGLIWMVHRLVGAAEQLTVRSRRQAGPEAMRLRPRDRVAAAIPATYYLQAQRIRHHLWMELQQLFDSVDVLLMAAVPGPAPEAERGTGNANLLVPWSCVGYPALTINGGLSANGLPLGLQLVGPPMRDYELLRAGAWCEQVLGHLPAPALN
jgi:aspartyl-tRNA(Asn)/glutamyl-tRNA(Gln) amidotransferase subunit A